MANFDDLPRDVRRKIFNLNFTEYEIEANFSISSLAHGDENREGDENFNDMSRLGYLILNVHIVLELTLPVQLKSEYLDHIIQGSKFQSRLGQEIHMGNESDIALHLYYFMKNKQKEILLKDPNNVMKYIEFEDPMELNDRESRSILFPIYFEIKKGFLGQEWLSPDEFETKIQPVKDLCIDAIHHIINYGAGKILEDKYYPGNVKQPFFSPPDTPPMEVFTYQKGMRKQEQPLVSNRSGKIVSYRTLKEQDVRLRSMYKLKTSSLLSKNWLQENFRDLKMTNFQKIDVPLDHDMERSISPRYRLQDEFWEELDVIPPTRSFWLWTGMEISKRKIMITLVDNRQLPLNRGVQYGNVIRKLKF